MSLFTIVRVVGTTQERLVGGPRAGALATSISFLLFLYCLVTLLVLCLHLLVICFQKSRPFFPVTMFAILRIVSPILRAKLVTDCFFLFSLPRFLLFLPPRNKNSNQSRTLVELKICNSLGKKKRKKEKSTSSIAYPRNAVVAGCVRPFLIKGQHFWIVSNGQRTFPL